MLAAVTVVKEIGSASAMMFFAEFMDKSFFLNVLYSSKYGWKLILLYATISQAIMITANYFAGILLKTILTQSMASRIGSLMMLFFGNYFVITSILEIKNNLTARKRKSSEENEAQLEALKNPNPSCLNYILAMVLMELGDKCQLGGITLSIKYNGLIIALGSFLGISVCNILAVSIGNYLKNKVRNDYIKLVCGITFILFGMLL